MRISDWSSDVCSSDLQVRVSAPSSTAEVRPTARPARGLVSLICFCATPRVIARTVVRKMMPGMSSRRPRRDMAVVLLSRSEEHTSELQSLMRISYAVFCLNKKILTNFFIMIYITHNQYHNSQDNNRH